MCIKILQCLQKNGFFTRLPSSGKSGTMPGNYKHKFGTPYHRNYRYADPESAPERKSFRLAANTYNIPRSTIFRKLHGMNGPVIGRPPILFIIEDKNIKRV